MAGSVSSKTHRSTRADRGAIHGPARVPGRCLVHQSGRRLRRLESSRQAPRRARAQPPSVAKAFVSNSRWRGGNRQVVDRALAISRHCCISTHPIGLKTTVSSARRHPVRRRSMVLKNRRSNGSGPCRRIRYFVLTASGNSTGPAGHGPESQQERGAIGRPIGGRRLLRAEDLSPSTSSRSRSAAGPGANGTTILQSSAVDQEICRISIDERSLSSRICRDRARRTSRRASTPDSDHAFRDETLAGLKTR
jgi:hypothetical protein